MPGDNRKTIGKSTGAIRSAPAKQETPTRTNTGNLQRKARAAPLDTPRFASFVRQDVAVVIEGERDPLFEPFIAGQFIRAQRDKAPEVAAPIHRAGGICGRAGRGATLSGEMCISSSSPFTPAQKQSFTRKFNCPKLTVSV